MRGDFHHGERAENRELRRKVETRNSNLESFYYGETLNL